MPAEVGSKLNDSHSSISSDSRIEAGCESITLSVAGECSREAVHLQSLAHTQEKTLMPSRKVARALAVVDRKERSMVVMRVRCAETVIDPRRNGRPAEDSDDEARRTSEVCLPSLKLPGSGNSWGCPTSQIGPGPLRNKRACHLSRCFSTDQSSASHAT